MDSLDKKLVDVFAGKVVRKDLVHHIKKAANVPSFVLEFLLSKYCATEDPAEIEEGKKAVLEVIESNYIRPDESNRAQSKVQQKGRHKFIDKVHVRYNERERRHWAEMENFGSKRIAINEKFYKENEKLLEGGIWAEVTVAHNDVEDDDYAFYVEDMRPIQLSRFNESAFFEGRLRFSRDEWIDVILRSVGLNPEIMEHPPVGSNKIFASGLRLKLHFIARLIPLVQNNFNFIELGPRGTGKSYFYSEFSPYSTLFSGGQASTATLLYNNARQKVGAVGFWDNIGFDEVGNMKIKDPDTIQIMKDYMANGRFSRGKEVIAGSSFSFVGNIDHSIDQLVNSHTHDLFITLPKAFDLAVQDRLFLFVPGWEVPKMDNKYFTDRFGLITDYMAEAFHYLFKHNKDFIDIVNRRLKLGKEVQGRDELAIKKSVAALLKIIHPAGEISDTEFYDIVEYAIEGRRRIKEQMNKRKPDDEFAAIDLSYLTAEGNEVVVYCRESRNYGSIRGESLISTVSPTAATEKTLKIHYGDTGYGFSTVFSDYLPAATDITIKDASIWEKAYLDIFARFCELLIKIGDCTRLKLIVNRREDLGPEHSHEIFDTLVNDLVEHGIEFLLEFGNTTKGCEIDLDNGWNISINKGLNYFQPLNRHQRIGVNDLDLRPCQETKIHFLKPLR